MLAKPLRDLILVLPDPQRTDITSAGIVILANTKSNASKEHLGQYGTIQALGPKCDDSLKIGDRICYGEFNSYPEYRENGVKYLQMQDKDIVGVIEEEAA